MSEASRLSVRVESESHGRKSTVSRLVTLDSIKEWILQQGFDEYTTQGLFDLAGRYPHAALPSFRRNINLMIQRVRAKRRQETGEDQDVQDQQQEAAEPQHSNLEDAFNFAQFDFDKPSAPVIGADPEPVQVTEAQERPEAPLPRRRISLEELAGGDSEFDPEA